MRHRYPGIFLTRKERKAFKARVEEFENATDCELVLHIRRHFPHDNATQANQELFHKFGLHKTTRRTGILLTLALRERKLAIWADEAVARRSGDELFTRVCSHISEGLKQGKHLQALLAGVDELQKTLALEQPSHGHHKNELPNDII